MPIVGDRPESGVRIQIERDPSRDEPPWTYAGSAHEPDASHPITVYVDAAGEVVVTGATAPPPLLEKIRLIVRTIYRQAKTDGEPPMWRIVRWRGEK